MNKPTAPTKKQMLAARASPRCLARNRAGKPCQRPAMKNKKRCNLHGGAHGSGAQPGNRNSLKHGHYTRSAIEARRLLRGLIANARDLTER